MVQTINLLLLAALLLPLCWKLRGNFANGVAYAVFLCVSVSTFVRIPLPGSLPQLTIFRLVLLILFFFWLRRPELRARLSSLPYTKWFWLWGLSNLLSLLFTTVGFLPSLKRYLDFVLEVWGFYLIVGTSIQTREQALRVLNAAACGLGVVACLAFIEKYSGFNPVAYIAPPDEETPMFRDVVATYQHRILLGTGMAMGLPLAFGLSTQAGIAWRRGLLLILALLLAGSCYFAQSRGPWLGAALAAMVLVFLGSAQIRRQLVPLGFLAVAVLLARPGVYRTLFDSAKVTADADSFKGGTFKYRLELWNVAWDQVSQSPIRFFLGYGPGCGLERDIEWELSYRGKTMVIESWDNHYAYDLFQSGILGLFARLILYFVVIRSLYRAYREASPADRDLLAALLASALVLVFMMSNVLIFSKQLNFLFWTIACVGPACLAASELEAGVPEALEPMAASAPLKSL